LSVFTMGESHGRGVGPAGLAGGAAWAAVVGAAAFGGGAGEPVAFSAGGTG
jgi:hypothetical protein